MANIDYNGILTPQNTTAKINFVLYTQSKANFEALTNKNASTIYFIALDKTIYLDGTYYGINQSDLSDLTTRLGTAESTISTHTSNISTLAQAINGTIDTVGGSIGVHNTAESGQTANYQYTTISSALHYLDEQLEALQAQTGTGSVASQIQSAINTFEASLNATVRGNLTDADAVLTGHKVGVKVIEADGLITNVTVVENDIASATELNGVSERVTTAEGAIATLNGSDTTAGSVAKAVKDAKTELKGTKKDGDTTAETIRGAKDYADSVASAAQSNAIAAAQTKIDELAGTNWTAAAGTVQDIIAELKADGSSVANLDTVVDKVRGDFTVGTGATATTDVKSYIDNKFTTATGSATTAESNAKSYADGLVNGLDKTVTDNYTAASGNNAATPTTGHVGVQVVQEDGKLKSVDIVESDIASAATLNTVSGVANTASTNASTALDHLTWTII